MPVMQQARYLTGNNIYDQGDGGQFCPRLPVKRCVCFGGGGSGEPLKSDLLRQNKASREKEKKKKEILFWHIAIKSKEAILTNKIPNSCLKF